MSKIKLELPYTTNYWKIKKSGKKELSNRYIERNTPGMIEIFEELWKGQAEIITNERVGTALTYRQLPGEIFTDIDKSFADFFPSVYKPFLQAAMIDATIGYGKLSKEEKAAALKTIKFPGLMTEINQKLGVNQVFDVSKREVQDFLIFESGYLITQMSENQKDAIRRLLARAIDEEWGIRRTTDTLKQGISLTEKLSNALVNKYNDEYDIAFKRFTEEFGRPASVAARQAADVAIREQEKYSKFLQKYRARMIARTELNRAKNETEKQCLDQLKETGKIKGAYKRWVRHGTTDPWESSIINEGVRIPYDQPFTIPGPDEKGKPTSTMTSDMYPCEINERCGLEIDLEV